MRRIQVYTFWCVAALAASGATNIAAAEPNRRESCEVEVSLTRLDCGRVYIGDLDLFSDTRAYVGQARWLTNGCYLIQHGDHFLLWDAGFPAALLGADVDLSTAGFSATVDATLEEQLASLGVGSDQIQWVGISHFHPDHTGQLPQFPRAKLLIGKADWEMLASGTQPIDVDPTPFSPWLDGRGEVSPVVGDLDLFNDGSVVLLQTPGHTASHYALLVQLKEMGPVILSGDAVHFEENYQQSRVPSFNLDRADTLASIDRISRLVHNLGATLVIQHEPDHIKRLPPFPEAAR